MTAALPTAARLYGRLAADIVADTLWPLRCALCDEPGSPLCPACERSLPYIDRWRACPRCGSPFGAAQCCECNPVALEAARRTEPPFLHAASAVELTRETRRIVTLYKDHGDRAASRNMGAIVAHIVSPDWRVDAVTFVPATRGALRRRGFDHGQLLAQETARILEKPCLTLLQRPRSADQRGLSRQDRWQNMEGRLKAVPGATVPASVLVVDDVFTTGATLFAASDALKAAGGRDVLCATFARAW